MRRGSLGDGEMEESAKGRGGGGGGMMCVKG